MKFAGFLKSPSALSCILLDSGAHRLIDYLNANTKREQRESCSLFVLKSVIRRKPFNVSRTDSGRGRRAARIFFAP